MKKFFTLVPPDRRPIWVLDDVTVVRLPLGEHEPVKEAKKRTQVAAGTLLAVHSSPNVGDIHSPLYGVIKDVTSAYIEIEGTPAPPQAKEGETTVAPPEPVDLNAPEDHHALCAALKSLGIAVRPFTRPCELFIINGLNPEPGMLHTQELLREYVDVLNAGVAMARRLNGGKPRFILALPNGSVASLEGVANRQVEPKYPISLARPLIRKLTGKESSAGVTLVRLHSIFTLGLVASSGLPLTKTVVTVQGNNFFTPVGTPLKTLFTAARTHFAPGDSVVIGGAMRGRAVAGVDIGIGKDDEAVMLLRKGETAGLKDNPCIGCGACVHVCPMRLRPNMLSRYSEFGQYERCRGEYIDACIECGMCGYVCPARRPMQQFFRMAKLNLGITSRQQQLAKPK